MLLAEIYGGLVYTGIAAIGDNRLGILWLALGMLSGGRSSGSWGNFSSGSGGFGGGGGFGGFSGGGASGGW